ncbi:hypothetical protein C1645_821738 [Glomus cerebriforme]|uniref:Serine-threonine/tyrosine-protein kinase catalytic domain-containing protein n=1 Tax=Glomus cerebriforme TaxID=658196 RepID=A0A397T636_9GLOM|nr:hypothetical protein C1645_821738 [Glomus cerebriforme]
MIINYLALDICCGKRPKIKDETPEFLKKLIQKCWDALPENLPTSKEVFYKIIKNKKQVEKLKELTYNFTSNTKSTTKTQLYKTHKQFIQVSVNMKLYCADLLCHTVPLYDRDFHDHGDLNDSSDINDLSDS